VREPLFVKNLDLASSYKFNARSWHAGAESSRCLKSALSQGSKVS
jgi:hypothetical protein